MLMSMEDKLDMMWHEMIDQESQIMFYLLEYEYGVFKNQNTINFNSEYDKLFVQALNHQIFKKYISYSIL